MSELSPVVQEPHSLANRARAVVAASAVVLSSFALLGSGGSPDAAPAPAAPTTAEAPSTTELSGLGPELGYLALRQCDVNKPNELKGDGEYIKAPIPDNLKITVNGVEANVTVDGTAFTYTATYDYLAPNAKINMDGDVDGKTVAQARIETEQMPKNCEPVHNFPAPTTTLAPVTTEAPTTSTTLPEVPVTPKPTIPEVPVTPAPVVPPAVKPDATNPMPAPAPVVPPAAAVSPSTANQAPAATAQGRTPAYTG